MSREEFKELIMNNTTPSNMALIGMLLSCDIDGSEVMGAIGMKPLFMVMCAAEAATVQRQGVHSGEMMEGEPHVEAVEKASDKVLEIAKRAAEDIADALAEQIESIEGCRCSSCQAANARMN